MPTTSKSAYLSRRPKAPPLSGVQHKLALSSARNGQRYCMPVKGTLSDLIAKLPVKGDDSQVFNEYACMQLAALAGVNIAQCRMVPIREMAGRPELVEALGADTHFLAVDRFDRGPSSAVHMEDACQLLRLMSGQKYAGREYFVRLVQVLNRFSTRGIEDVRQFFICQTVNTLLGNSDAHLKNFSMLYHNGLMPELSSAYGIVCVAALPGFQGFGTNVAIDQYQRKETVDDFLSVAKSAGISERIARAAVKQTVSRAKELWPKRSPTYPLPMRCAPKSSYGSIPFRWRDSGGRRAPARCRDIFFGSDAYFRVNLRPAGHLSHLTGYTAHQDNYETTAHAANPS